MSKRVLVAGLAVIAVLTVTIGVLWFYGAPQPGSTVAATQAQLEAAPMAEAPAAQAPSQGKPEVAPATGEAPAPDPNSPLAISIPGCKCHSDDPKLVKEHEGYRMNQCAGCHAGQTPTGQ